MTTADTRPFIRLRGRSIMALVLAPEAPLAEWLTALDAQMERSPNFFDNRPVVADLSLLPQSTTGVAELLGQLEARGIRVIGTEGAHPSWAGVEKWGRPLPASGKPGKPVEIPETPPKSTAKAAPAPVVAEPHPHDDSPTALVIAEPIRSGQSVVFERGDVTILGSVSSGAEVMAGGSVHVYGVLRGRAVAGLAGNAKARIFCRKLQAELIAIDGVYLTADDMPAALVGKPVQAWLDGEQMKITALE